MISGLSVYRGIQKISGLSKYYYSHHIFQVQHTIGFGYRGSTHKCHDAVALQCLQSVVGVLLEVIIISYHDVSCTIAYHHTTQQYFHQAALTGVFFVKLSRPKRRQATVVFSKNAVIYRFGKHMKISLN